MRLVVRNVALVALLSLGASEALSGDKVGERQFTQQPEIAPAQVRVEGATKTPASKDPAMREAFNVLPGFQVERLYTVPADVQGSWVAITFDNKGRLIASDQGGQGLCRITPPPIGSDEPTKVEQLDLKISAAQGLLYAFDSLYLSINNGGESGLYRARDTNGDDQYDELLKLADFHGDGEHGSHALRLSPDGKSIYVVCGNFVAPPTKIDASRIPTNWAEDLLLPRQFDANGFGVNLRAPGGWIASTDPDGKTWEIFSMGYRNTYSMDFNAEGELFAYDSDMEWDMGMPWYRPTRVMHAASGGEFGWRTGSGKWPTYYVDSLPSLLDIGPGSPVGVRFGYGTKFPAKYQKALFILDWTFGTMYALHLEPEGASYKAVKEEFVSRTPLPLTDIAIGPDGALYFTIGGRGTQSELFRMTYVGDESTAPVDARDAQLAELRTLRRTLESHHRQNAKDPQKVVELAYPYLNHADRHIRYAARIAIEHQPVEFWEARVLGETDPIRLTHGVVALARQGNKSLQPKLFAALDRVEMSPLSEYEQLAVLRAHQLICTRMGQPDEATQKKLIAKFDPLYPAQSDAMNRELSSLLVYLRAPNVIAKTVPLMTKDSAKVETDMQELLDRNTGYGQSIAAMLATKPELQQIHYALVLRNLKDGWNKDQRKAYFLWFDKAAKWSGGASFGGFLHNIKNEALANCSDEERKIVAALDAIKPYSTTELPKPQGPGQEWTLEQVIELADAKLKSRNFERGRQMFEGARCVVCHRFSDKGGATGPDLTQLAGRFNLKDLSEAIVHPNKVISDQYRASTVQTADGKIHTGRIVEDTADAITVAVDPEDLTKSVEIKREDIEEIKPSPISLMPTGLLNSLNEDEVLDLLAYLLSRGDHEHPVFSVEEE